MRYDLVIIGTGTAAMGAAMRARAAGWSVAVIDFRPLAAPARCAAATPRKCSWVLVEEQTDRVRGAHLVGPHADEVINLFALAIRYGLKAGELKATMLAYPTGASDIGYML
jgi:pyruvate/2-oxoglutarate dehydrogenase complex dihydrolipoamide dehydrogenase (E3) component